MEKIEIFVTSTSKRSSQYSAYTKMEGTINCLRGGGKKTQMGGCDSTEDIEPHDSKLSRIDTHE